MLARLQQATTLGALLLAAGIGGWLWRAGHPLAAVAGAGFVLAAYAFVLALEFALLVLAHGDDPTPRASAAQLLRAWCGEVRSAPVVFCWRQPWRSGRWPDLLPPDARGRRGVLLVHGFVCNRGLWNPWLEKLTAQRVPFVALNLEPVFGSIDDYVDRIDDAVRALEQATGVPPVVVAHSMGGLVLRRWWAEDGGDARIHHAITIGTPHQGTWLARFARSHNARQMQRTSAWLAALVEREAPARAQRFTCFYSACDNIVFPPATATLPGADNRCLPCVAHIQMADEPAPWHELQRRLAEPAGNGHPPAASPVWQTTSTTVGAFG